MRLKQGLGVDQQKNSPLSLKAGQVRYCLWGTIEDLAWWFQTDQKRANKILTWLPQSLRPFIGIPEKALKHLNPDTWSRRITGEHRLVYRVSANAIYFFASTIPLLNPPKLSDLDTLRVGSFSWYAASCWANLSWIALTAHQLARLNTTDLATFRCKECRQPTQWHSLQRLRYPLMLSFSSAVPMALQAEL